MHDEAYKRIMEQAGKKQNIHVDGVHPVNAFDQVKNMAAQKQPIFHKVHEDAEHYKQ